MTTVVVGTVLQREEARQLRALARLRGLTVSTLLRDMIRRELAYVSVNGLTPVELHRRQTIEKTTRRRGAA